jgi:hypothetical protein
MNTTFNLVGFFARKTRSRIGGPVTEHPQEAVTLQGGISLDTVNKHSPDQWEHYADVHAQQHSKYTPYEKKWMIDWQLVEVQSNEVRAA